MIQKSSNQCFQVLDNFIVNPEALTITWLLDCGTRYAAHASHEFFHSFYDLYSFLPGPCVTDPQNLAMDKARLYRFPDRLPESSSRDQSISAEARSEEDINWNLSQMWVEELDKVGALRPARMRQDAEKIKALYLFAQYLSAIFVTAAGAESGRGAIDVQGEGWQDDQEVS
jgi:hypothetical protein